MSDSGFRNRVKGLFGAPPAEGELMEPAPADHADAPDPDSERQALQVLVLAQRTADEHMATVQREAERIRSDAVARADELVLQAQANSELVRRKAKQVLADAQAQAEQITRDARSEADGIRREAQEVLSEAQGEAARIIETAEAKGDELDREAQQRYEDIVGSLEAQRAALREEVDALQQFDKDYRTKLAKFMLSQLRALGFDEHAAPLDGARVPAQEKRRTAVKDKT